MLANMLSKKDCPEEIRAIQKNQYFRAYREAIDFALYTLEKEGKEKALEMARARMEATYEEEMFPFSWMREVAVSDDIQKLERVLEYLFSEEETVERIKVKATMKTTLYDGCIDAVVDLILKRKSGKSVAVLLNLGKGSRGPKGRSLKTQAQGNPAAVVAKGFLEKTYPGVIIWDVYLSSPQDSPGCIAGQFYESQTAESQLQVLPYSQFYVNGVWDAEKFAEFADQAFREIPEPPCMFCTERYLCKNGGVYLEPMYDLVEEEPDYVLPRYTDAQDKIVHQEDGASLVVAGPGSGKTATLVGRLSYLVKEKKVPPEFILAITFTKKAAGEIKERCKAFLQDGEEIQISTLNALGYRILCDHATELGIEEYHLMTAADSLNLIDSLLDSLGHPLYGFSYAKKEGSKGLLNTVRGKIAKYRQDPDAFREREKNVGEDFYELAENYLETVREGHLIDFSEQITLCLKLLREDSDLLAMYQDMFWYVCVDEYQDIDKDQCDLIDMLAAGHGNLLAIGDDDQSIYEWRGGSPRFMRDFKNRYPDGRVYYLSQNFRSSKEIVELAASSLTAEEKRFDKEIISTRDVGIPPVILDNADFKESVGEALEDAKKKNIEPDDVAVLSWSNSTLEGIFKGLKEAYPVVLEKEMLCRSAFFAFVKDALILRSELTDDLARREFFSLFGVKNPEQAEFSAKYLAADCSYPYVEIGNEGCAYSCLKALCSYDAVDASAFVAYAAEIAGYSNQPVAGQITEIIETKGIVTLKCLREEMEKMVKFQDDKGLDAIHPGRTILTTVHEAKGREWKAVVVVDDFGTKPSPDIKRLIYVALTRAEDLLYICKSGKSLLVS